MVSAIPAAIERDVEAFQPKPADQTRKCEDPSPVGALVLLEERPREIERNHVVDETRILERLPRVRFGEQCDLRRREASPQLGEEWHRDHDIADVPQLRDQYFPRLFRARFAWRQQAAQDRKERGEDAVRVPGPAKLAIGYQPRLRQEREARYRLMKLRGTNVMLRVLLRMSTIPFPRGHGALDWNHGWSLFPRVKSSAAKPNRDCLLARAPQ